MCEDCHESGVIVPALILPTKPSASAPAVDSQTGANDTEAPFQVCFECTRTYATDADLIAAYNTEQGEGAPAVTTAEDITFCPECLHDFLYPPTPAVARTPGEARVCGNCDADISVLRAEARFCSAACRDAVEPAVAAQRPAPGVVTVRFVEPKRFPATAPERETKTDRNSAMSVGIDVVMFALPHLTEYQAETGLRAAVAHWANGKVTGAGVAAAARAWTRNGEDYDDMKPWAQGKENTAALKVLTKAIRAAHEYNAAISTSRK
ncbi:hypothetical protein [Alloactinosynnema sp. L-07]|nr:hypothetical protein [Alloactinosynnema sp. L-07]